MVGIHLNQDCTSLAVSCESGYQLHSLSNVEQLDRIYLNDVERGTYIVERLFSSSLLVVVNHHDPNVLKVCHFKKGSEICDYRYPSKILSVRLNRQAIMLVLARVCPHDFRLHSKSYGALLGRLVICLADQYHIHNIRDMQVLHILKGASSNPSGLFALSIANDTGYVAYPGSDSMGCLEIFDSMSMTPKATIAAHNGPIAAVVFSFSSNMVATASTKGTVIRIFSVSEGEKIYEFRRGLKRYVSISCLAFSQDEQYLCASSNTETVHIFKLGQSCREDREEDNSWTGYMTSAFKTSAASLIPTTVSEAFSAWRAFATARLSGESRMTACGIARIAKEHHVFVANDQAVLSVFKLDTEAGGECQLVATKRLDVPDDNNSDEVITENNNTKSGNDTAVRCDEQTVCDASYAYKLKREKRLGTCSPTQELDEILDNVPNFVETEERGSPSNLKLDDVEEFPPMN